MILKKRKRPLIWDDRDGVIEFDGYGQLFQIVNNYLTAKERRELGRWLVDMLNAQEDEAK